MNSKFTANKTVKWIVLVLFETITLGIPLYIRHLIKNPRKTLKISAIVFPLIACLIWLFILIF